MKVSLWLIPPEPTFSTLQHQINNISKSSNNVLPSFIPHVTIVGGITVPLSNKSKNSDDNYDNSDSTAIEMLKKLKTVFQNDSLLKEGIPCSFEVSLQYKDILSKDLKVVGNDTGVFSVFQKNEEVVKWNQSCVSLMNKSPEYLQSVRITQEVAKEYDQKFHDICEKQNKNLGVVTFPPPVEYPHYSFAYGSKPEVVFDYCLSVPPTFVAKDFALYCTSPATLEGVSDSWYEIGRFSLP